MTDSKQLVQKLWNYCDILRDDGLSPIWENVSYPSVEPRMSKNNGPAKIPVRMYPTSRGCLILFIM